MNKLILIRGCYPKLNDHLLKVKKLKGINIKNSNQMKTNTISIRVSDQHLAELSKLYSKMPGTSAGKAVKNFLNLRRNGFTILKGTFAKNEMEGILATFNNTILESSFYAMRDNNNLLITLLQDVETLERISKSYDFDYDKMIKKVKKLDHLQTFILFDECYRFWHDEAAYGAPAPNLEKFLNDIC